MIDIKIKDYSCNNPYFLPLENTHPDVQHEPVMTSVMREGLFLKDFNLKDVDTRETLRKTIDKLLSNSIR